MKPSPRTLFSSVPAFVALFATLIVAAAAFIPPLASSVNLLYPLISLITAALLLWQNPPLYIGFMWWVWFTTPEIRRVVDFQIGFSEQSPVMLTPFLVTGLALVAILRQSTRLPPLHRTPFAFLTLGLLYAYIIGLLNNGLATATFDLLNWSVPIISGAYLLTHRQYAHAFRTVVYRTFVWALIIIGSYTLIQFFYLPPWDAYWLDAVAHNSVSFGVSEPLEVRVFGTLNSPVPFAIVVMVGLLLLFSGNSAAKLPATVLGFIGFALSSVRSAWGGWVVGVVILAAGLSLRARARFLGIFILLAVLTVPLLKMGAIGELLSERLQTIGELENDTSFNDRVELYTSISQFTANNPLGQGLGSTGAASSIGNENAEFSDLDSGIIAVVYTFGILGSFYYIGGALALFGMALGASWRSSKPFAASYTAIIVALLSQLLFSNIWPGVSGMLLWFFPCLYLAMRYADKPMVESDTSRKIIWKGPIKVYKS